MSFAVYEDPRVAELEQAYEESCAHNGRSIDDITYFRRYIFVMFALMSRGIEELRND